MMQAEESPLPRILEEISSLNTKLHELSVRNYRQVVDARQSLSRCATSSVELETKVDLVSNESLPVLRERLTSFQDVGKKVLQQHKKTTATIDLHSQLVDLLQIPQLMDTCARSGAIEEALELCSFARTLRTRHDAIAESIGGTGLGNGGAEIVRWVAEEVEQSAQAMRRQLLQQLRGQVDLPTCLRLLSYLKRLDAQRQHQTNQRESASSLRREFLEARDAYLQLQTTLSAPSSSAGGDPAYQTTLKQIQKNREIWFDVVTQYQAIFGLSATDAVEDDTLSRWLGSKVAEFLFKLRDGLAKFDNCGELGMVFELSSSFAASLSRVGGDFRPLLPSLFIKRAQELMVQQWTQASNQAREAFSSGDWGEALPTAQQMIPSTPGREADGPPLQLLQTPCLVELVNALLRSFNDLRSFACVNITRELAQELKQALERAVEGLEMYSVDRESPNQVKRLDLVLELMYSKALPYIAKCFGMVFDWKRPIQTLLDVNPLCDRVRNLMTVKPSIANTTPSLVGASSSSSLASAAMMTTPVKAPATSTAAKPLKEEEPSVKEEEPSVKEEESPVKEDESTAATESEE